MSKKGEMPYQRVVMVLGEVLESFNSFLTSSKVAIERVKSPYSRMWLTA